jgi:hypothetical protein
MRKMLAALAIPAAGLIAALTIPLGSGASIPGAAPFDGVVNGMNDAASVQVICPGGPAGTGTAKNTTILDVLATISSDEGRMGSFAGSVIAKVYDEPGALLGTGATFTSYSQPQAIAAITLPCSGFGEIRFEPSPNVGKTKQNDIVGVQFVDVAS